MGRRVQSASSRLTPGQGERWGVIATGLDGWNLTRESYVKGEQRQRGSLREMIFPVDVIIRFIAAVMSLEPGGVLEVAIDGTAGLRLPVLAAGDRP